jgi:hypothetical protein
MFEKSFATEKSLYKIKKLFYIDLHAKLIESRTKKNYWLIVVEHVFRVDIGKPICFKLNLKKASQYKN